ncbi:HIT family protein [Janibacter corallicola]|uniref:HIT family protein n=1 Tax=Janibacter corallicola TaxID=415212 RepID=UPI000836D705|nr:HIT family protein [Janibacter corallicola]
MSDCIFCAIVAEEAPSLTVHRDETTVAFLDIHPATEGHLLVVPRRHSTDLMEISDSDLTDVVLTARRLARAVTGVVGAQGVNLLNCCGAEAWQTVFHFHMHVIPRFGDKERDPLELPWRPDVPGDPDSMQQVATRLGDRLG